MTTDLNIGIDQFDYKLPDERIAKYPLKERDNSKLLIFNKKQLSHDSFKNIAAHLPCDSLIVFNNTRVISARLFFQKPSGAQIEIFCLEPNDPKDFGLAFSSLKKCQWNCLVGNLKKWKSGQIFMTLEKENTTIEVRASLIEKLDTYNVVKFEWDNECSFGEIMDIAGRIPIPPYLNRESEENDKTTYQTIYSSIKGSVAAPTAGLHFTEKVLKYLSDKNIKQDEITLHVGAGTFKPISSDTIQDHVMHNEFFTVSLSTIKNLIEKLGAITAVGTTTVRTLESLYFIGVQILRGKTPANHHFIIDQWEPYAMEATIEPIDALNAIQQYLVSQNRTTLSASTSIIIIPGYKHKLINYLVTNFHQPRSTLLLLLASFVGEEWKTMYDIALKNDYRFLSYGDSCLIIP